MSSRVLTLRFIHWFVTAINDIKSTKSINTWSPDACTTYYLIDVIVSVLKMLIGESFLSNEELMKFRYLKVYWGREKHRIMM